MIEKKYFTFQPFKRNILPSHNELLEKQIKTIIMSITIAINRSEERRVGKECRP